jgi:hypothetical protein
MPGRAERGGDGRGAAAVSQHYGVAPGARVQAITASGQGTLGGSRGVKWPVAMTARHAGDDARPATSCLAMRAPSLHHADRAVPLTRGCALTSRLARRSLLLASPATAGPRTSGASRPASWTAGWQAATPARSSSSAASAAIIPTWITPRSPRGCSRSAARTRWRQALQPMRTTSGLKPAADGPRTPSASPARPGREPTGPGGLAAGMRALSPHYASRGKYGRSA